MALRALRAYSSDEWFRMWYSYQKAALLDCGLSGREYHQQVLGFRWFISVLCSCISDICQSPKPEALKH